MAANIISFYGSIKYCYNYCIVIIMTMIRIIEVTIITIIVMMDISGPLFI